MENKVKSLEKAVNEFEAAIKLARENSFRPEAEAKMEEIKEKVPHLYKIMDAGRNMYNIGQATKKILEFI